jgi:hypothetical protein
MSLSSWSALAEDRIKIAIESGEFDNLPGTGKPLDLAEYFSVPAGERMAFSVLKSAGVTPCEVEWLREIHRLESAIRENSDPQRHRQLTFELQEVRVKLAFAMERRVARRRQVEPARDRIA